MIGNQTYRLTTPKTVNFSMMIEEKYLTEIESNLKVVMASQLVT